MEYITMPTFRIKQNSSKRSIGKRECGCAGKGPHKSDCDSQNSGRRMRITQAESKTTTGRLNFSNVAKRVKRQDIELDDETIETLLLHQIEDSENIWSLLDEAPHKTVQAFVFSENSKNDEVAYFNKLNSPDLRAGHIFYTTRNGGVGVNAQILEGGFQEGDMVGLIMVDLGNVFDLADDNES